MHQTPLTWINWRHSIAPSWLESIKVTGYLNCFKKFDFTLFNVHFVRISINTCVMCWSSFSSKYEELRIIDWQCTCAMYEVASLEL